MQKKPDEPKLRSKRFRTSNSRIKNLNSIGDWFRKPCLAPKSSRYWPLLGINHRMLGTLINFKHRCLTLIGHHIRPMLMVSMVVSVVLVVTLMGHQTHYLNHHLRCLFLCNNHIQLGRRSIGVQFPRLQLITKHPDDQLDLVIRTNNMTDLIGLRFDLCLRTYRRPLPPRIPTSTALGLGIQEKMGHCV